MVSARKVLANSYIAAYAMPWTDRKRYALLSIYFQYLCKLTPVLGGHSCAARRTISVRALVLSL